MTIILIGRPFKRPLRLELDRPGVRWALGVAGLAGASVLFGLSFLIGQLVGDVRGVSRTQIEQLRAQLASQQEALAATEQTAQNDVQAMALQLGELKAHAARLNAFGQRLTRIGKLDDGEFAFDGPPAVGGPEGEPVMPQYDLFGTAFGREMERLRRQFQQQDEQLAVLESLLIGRDLSESTMPKGMPVSSGYISSGYGPRADPVHGAGRYHQGVDFAGPYGSDVLAVAAGVVTWSGLRNGFGYIVEIDHGNGYKTRYAHNSKNLVAVGDVVEAGQRIARMGNSGRSTGSHVHFEVWFDGKPVNPTEFVSAIRG